ncbi:MAG: hypothetical protein KF725_01095 [Cyclobacteriaceae bacterium]|nr:hypothetical protein [Cyclobacteriaceae bacterium]UYN86948.1 MAG: hypothetical protein KIT51_01310 [Cyclobacteriaceae bacterium]
MRKLAYLILACLFLTLSANEAYSQMNRRNIKKNNKRIASYRGKKSNFGKDKIYNSLGVSLNAFNYFGDLAPSPKRLSTDIGFTRPAVGVSFTHRFGPRYQVTGSFMYGGIRGSDADSADPNDADNGVFRYVRNLSFRNRIKELSAIAQVDLFENQATYISRVPWTPYVYAGIAVFHHNPQAQVPQTDLLNNPFSDAGQWVDLKPLQTEGKSYSLIQAAIPFGLGARFRINEVMDLSAEFGFRYTFTDYLDDVSGNYVDLTTLSSEKARAMAYRSNEVQPVNARVQEIIANRYTGYGSFDTVSGYGHINSDGTMNMRGRAGDRDIYMVTTVRLTYILGKTFHRAKFR